jgi:catechol 2,3-dioxygenase-like lactoylglutathione lyase family enzyme
MRKRGTFKVTFALLILAQAAHSVNAALVAFGAWCFLWPVRVGWPSAVSFGWMWVMLETINGIVHPFGLCAKAAIRRELRPRPPCWHWRSTSGTSCEAGPARLHKPGAAMFGHVKFGVSDYAASKAFFLQALAPLGVAVGAEGSPDYGVELCSMAQASLCLFQTAEKPAHLHLAFAARNRGQVEAFYRAALAAGGKDNGPPGLRPNYHANYYAAFVIGPDGHNIEAVCHEPEVGA